MANRACLSFSNALPVASALTFLVLSVVGVFIGARLLASLRVAHDPVWFRVPRTTRVLGMVFLMLGGVLVGSFCAWWLLTIPPC